MSVVHSRLDEKNIKTLDQLARAKGSSRSQLIREAVHMYLAAYTGEPDLYDHEKRLRMIESELNKLEALLNDVQHRDPG